MSPVQSPERARQAFLPASTFKIANALIGLETGAVRDEREVMEWDGLKRGVPAWNQDTDLASGMRNSTVWFYQAMVRRIGAARMREWADRLDYGNGGIGADDAIDISGWSVRCGSRPSRSRFPRSPAPTAGER